MSVETLDTTFPSSESWSEYLTDKFHDFSTYLFRAASFLTDPACKAHELKTAIIMPLIPRKYNQCDSKVKEIARRTFLSFQLMFFAPLALITGPLGMAFRFAAICCQRKPFIHLVGNVSEKTLPENGNFSMYSLNACCIGGGYPLIKGGVLPWNQQQGNQSSRLDLIIDKINEQDPDVLCLNEIYDLTAAYKIYSKLKNKFSHFYFNIGAKNIGASSGILVASKHKISDPKFIPFSEDSLIKEGKFVKKGDFSFTLKSQDKKIGQIYVTHLQHSCDDSEVSPAEKNSREQQITEILNEMEKSFDPHIPIILTGDLNLGTEEYTSSSLASLFHNSYPEEKGGTCSRDGFVNHIWKGKPLNNETVTLDYALLLRQKPFSNETTSHNYTSKTERIDSFDIEVPDLALSDHHGLKTNIS